MKSKNLIKKALIYSLIGATVAGNVVPAYAYTNSVGNVDETGTVTTDTEAESCEVYATLASSFKVTIPKKITLDGGTKKGSYTVDVEGDIGGTDTIKVVPDASVALSSTNLADVTASISQDKTEWSYNQILADSKVAGNGLIDASGITAGAWNGTFNFNVKMYSADHTHMHAEDDMGIVTLEPTCTNIGIRTYTCTECDEIYTEEISKLEHNYVDHVCTECNAQEAGLYDADGVMLCTWEDSGIDVETDYTSSNYQTATTSGYYVLRNNYPTATKIVIPDNTTSIGNYAFSVCNQLTDVTIPDSVTSIGEWAFRDCTKLTDITIPEGVTVIKNSTFYYCTGLTSITMPSSLTSIGTSAFYECKKLASVTIPEGVNSIGNSAFYGCEKLTNVIIPESVTSIGKSAFSNCTNLINVEIPDSVTSIGNIAFSNTPWLTAKQAENPLVIVNGILIDGKAASGDVIIPNDVTSIAGSAFKNCTGITSITIPEGITSIGDFTFYQCTNLTSVTIPDSVTDIRTSAFDGCKNLTSITISSNVKNIENYAFFGCKGLVNVTIENGVTNIGDYAFAGCINVTNITIPDSVTSIGNTAFNNVPHIYYNGTATGSPWGALAIN